MIQIAVCDDEALHCEIAKEKIEQCMQKLNVPCRLDLFSSGAALLESKADYDILFMDIELKNEKNGLVIASEYVQTRRTRIILLTSHIEEMPNGYKIHAFRFLTKPIDSGLLTEALENALDEIDSEKRLIVKNETCGQSALYLDDMIYAEAGSKSCCLRTIHDVCTYPHGIEQLKNELDSSHFYQTHRTYIINLRYIKSVDNYITMITGEKIPLSRRKKKDFLEIYRNFIRRELYDR